MCRPSSEAARRGPSLALSLPPSPSLPPSLPFSHPPILSLWNERRVRNGLWPVPSVEDLAGAVDRLGGVAEVLRCRVSAVGRAQSVEHCIADLCRPIHRSVITGPARLALFILRLDGGCLRWIPPSILGGRAEAAASESLFCLQVLAVTRSARYTWPLQRSHPGLGQGGQALLGPGGGPAGAA